MPMEKGYVQIYTGDGKGKTTAALGLAMRAVGNGLKVLMYQFLKGTPSGELVAAQKLYPNFEIKRIGQTDKFVWQMEQEQRLEISRRLGTVYGEILEIVASSRYDIIILDEIMGAIHAGFFNESQVCRIIENKNDKVELILTGRSVPEKVGDMADLITEMVPIKHYMDKGIRARLGIEY